MNQKIKFLLTASVILVFAIFFTACKDEKIPASSDPSEERLILESVNSFFEGFSTENPDFGDKLISPDSNAEKKQKNFPLKKIIVAAQELGIEGEKFSPYVCEIVSLYEFKAGEVTAERDKATVTVEASVPDMKKALEKCMSEKMVGEYLKIKGKSSKEFEKVVADVISSNAVKERNEILIDFLDWVFPKVMKNVKINSVQTSLELEKVNGKWLVCDTGKIF